jgi:DNA-binding transcriptional MerR regulator
MTTVGGTWTPKALAASLGISPTTLRTWESRYGIGPAIREPGRHRRYSDEDVGRLEHMVGLIGRGMAPAAAAAAALDRPATARRHDGGRQIAAIEHPDARGFARAAARLDAPLMCELALRSITRHGVVTAWQEVFAPMLVELGRRTSRGEDGVEIEHLASACVVHALSGVPQPARLGKLPALLACAPEEQHSLPMHALAAALSEQGCSSVNLGGRVPPRAILDAVMRLRPMFVVVWAHRPALAELVPVARVLDAGSAVLAAGPGWAELDLPERAVRVTSLPDAVSVIAERPHWRGRP